MDRRTSEPIQKPRSLAGMKVMGVAIIVLLVGGYLWYRYRENIVSLDMLTSISSMIPALIVFFLVYFVIRKVGMARGVTGNDQYKRLEMWISKRIGRIDDTISEGDLKSKLEDLYMDEKDKIKNIRQLKGFRSYIDSCRYQGILKKN